VLKIPSVATPIYKKVLLKNSNNITAINNSAIKAGNNSKLDTRCFTGSFLNNSNLKQSYILDRSTSKPLKANELLKSKQDKEKEDIKGNNKSRNPKVDSYLKMTTLKNRPCTKNKTVDKDINRMRNTLDSIKSRSGKNNGQSREKDIAILSSNYLLLKKKVEQLRSNLENRSNIGIELLNLAFLKDKKFQPGFLKKTIGIKNKSPVNLRSNK
jgi:hypothetical protein